MRNRNLRRSWDMADIPKRSCLKSRVEKQDAKAKAVTLAQAFEDFLEARKSLKPRTVSDYSRAMTKYFGDWLNKPLTQITKDMVERRHSKLGKAHGAAQANQAMRTLRAIFNFAAGKYEDARGRSLIPENPVKRLSQTRAWYRVEHRRTVIKPHELSSWYGAVMVLNSDWATSKAEVVRDYLLLLLFTGLRRTECATLRWEDVDLEGKTLTVIDTKNREPHTLPLSDFLYDLLSRRLEQSDSDHVFPGSGRTGHIVEPRRHMERVAEQSGVSFTLHDLRRTFITAAERLDIPAYALKRLLNHKIGNDVTAGYIVADVERLRKPMQIITNYFLSAMEVKPESPVIEFGVKQL